MPSPLQQSFSSFKVHPITWGSCQNASSDPAGLGTRGAAILTKSQVKAMMLVQAPHSPRRGSGLPLKTPRPRLQLLYPCSTVPGTYRTPVYTGEMNEWIPWEHWNCCRQNGRKARITTINGPPPYTVAAISVNPGKVTRQRSHLKTGGLSQLTFKVPSSSKIPSKVPFLGLLFVFNGEVYILDIPTGRHTSVSFSESRFQKSNWENTDSVSLSK